MAFALPPSSWCADQDTSSATSSRPDLSSSPTSKWTRWPSTPTARCSPCPGPRPTRPASRPSWSCCSGRPPGPLSGPHPADLADRGRDQRQAGVPAVPVGGSPGPPVQPTNSRPPWRPAGHGHSAPPRLRPSGWWLTPPRRLGAADMRGRPLPGRDDPGGRRVLRHRDLQLAGGTDQRPGQPLPGRPLRRLPGSPNPRHRRRPSDPVVDPLPSPYAPGRSLARPFSLVPVTAPEGTVPTPGRHRRCAYTLEITPPNCS